MTRSRRYYTVQMYVRALFWASVIVVATWATWAFAVVAIITLTTD